jgi:hypothetical protein
LRNESRALGWLRRAHVRHASLLDRVRAPFFAAADRVAEVRFAGAFLAVDFFAARLVAAVFATFLAADFLTAFFAPPVSLFTVAHARFSAVFFETPFLSYPFSMCSAWRFCFGL